LIVAALTVTDEVPLDVSLTVCVDGVFRLTLPKATVLEPSVSAVVPEVAGCSFSAQVSSLSLSDAVSVAVCAAVTADAVAVNPALFAPEAMVTDAGTFTALLLLARVTARLLLALLASVTVQASVPAPFIELLVQLSALNATCDPVPLFLW
jgi:hypothetical protein